MTVQQYATSDDLEAYLADSGYTVPAEPTRILLRASEVVAEATQWMSERVFFTVDDDHPATANTNALRDATCAQVEFWLEVGEEHDVQNSGGSTTISKVQISRQPPKLGLRAYRHLMQVGLVSAKIGITL